MIKKLILSVAVATVTFSAAAKILRVGLDYPTLAAAHTAAAAGDTLQIYGTHSGSISKRLVLIGFGYNFDVHPNLQAIGTESPSNLSSISFASGSDSSIAEGLEITATIAASKVIIRRSRGGVFLANNVNSINDVKVFSCVLTGGGMQYTNNPCINFQITNSIISGQVNMNGPLSTGYVINCVSPSTAVIGNSDFLSLAQASFLVKNCIFNYYSGSNINTVYESNLFSSPQPGTSPQGSNNRWGQNFANIFDRLGGSSDNPGYHGNALFDENYYILKAGSPAINAGFDAANNPTDCGIFGGEAVFRYRLSGVPAIPSFYKLTAPGSSATTNPYNVTISVRSNN